MIYLWLGAMCRAGCSIIEQWKGPTEPAPFTELALFVFNTIKEAIWS